MKYAIGTVIGTALLGLAKSSLLGSKNDRVTVKSIEELLRYTNDPSLAPLVTGVDLSFNELTTLPKEIGNLKNLEWLFLGNNQLTTLPPEIWKLTNLRMLALRGNKLTNLLPKIGRLKNLKRLNLYYNQLTTLPPEIGKLKNLKDLDLRGNPRFYMNPEQLHQLILNGANKYIQKKIVSANVIPTISNVRLR